MLNHSKSNQRPEVLDQERFWIPKVKLLALHITNRQRCQTQYRGSISLLHLMNELLMAQITDSDSRLHSHLIPRSKWQHRLLLSPTPKSWESGKPSEHCKSSRGLSVSQSILNYWTTSLWITAVVDLYVF